jgi:hypothetical protein
MTQVIEGKAQHVMLGLTIISILQAGERPPFVIGRNIVAAEGSRERLRRSGSDGMLVGRINLGVMEWKGIV